jgi:ketol-acid reductoisomerase
MADKASVKVKLKVKIPMVSPKATGAYVRKKIG